MSLGCTDHLIEEHRLILRAVYVIDAMADQAKQLKMPDASDVEALLSFFHLFADEHHQTKEESILFPSLRTAASNTTSGPLDQMVFEHQQERFLIRALQDALRTQDHSAFAHFGKRFSEILGNHIYKEDNILFSLVPQKISGEIDQSLVQQMEDFDRTLPPGRYQEWTQTVNQLEWKYLNKMASA